MSTSNEQQVFAAELRQRFEALATWAINNAPDKQHPLQRKDFDMARKEIDRLAEGRQDIGERNAAIPEPSENGPQYVSTHPAPWP